MRDKFLNRFNIHNSYKDFFDEKRIKEIKKFLKKIEDKEFAPKKENIFRSLEHDIEKQKVLILGKDPYFQPGAATGICFEVNGLDSWIKPFRQRSLQNMVRVIYKSYKNEMKNFTQIREEIKEGEMKIVPPNKIFSNWHRQGVILLNSFLTVEIDGGKNTSGSHEGFWRPFTQDLLEYISRRNKEISYFLWGNHAKSFLKNIKYGEVYSSYHPAMAFGKKEKDFLFFDGFEKTRDKIYWLGK